jgi:serine protease Do
MSFYRKWLLGSWVLCTVSLALQGGFFKSNRNDGRDYLRSVHQAVEDVVRQVSAGVVYMEISLKNEERVTQLSLNGLVLDEKGHVLTLYFDEERITDIKVWLGAEEYAAKLVKSDRINSFTLIKVETDELTSPVKFGDSLELSSGAFLVGLSASSRNLGFEPVVNFGTLKAVVEGTRDVLHVNGFDLKHNSDMPTLGMPIFNLDGEVLAVGQGRSIGLTDLMARGAKKFLAKKDSEEEEEGEEPWIGINYEAVSEELSKAFELPREGVRLTRIYRGSPAGEAGLQVGDVIVAIDGQKLTRKGIRALSQLRRWLDPEIGRSCRLSLLRQGRLLEKEMTFRAKDKVTSISIEEFGLTVNDISPIDHYSYALKVNEGVLVTGIEGGSPAATSTYFGRPLIQRGDVIIEVHGHKVADISQLRSVLEQLREQKVSAVYIRLQRGNRPTSVSLDTAIGQKTRENGEEQ